MWLYADSRPISARATHGIARAAGPSMLTHEPLHPIPELVRLHVVRITAKANVAPARVDRIGFRLAKASQLRHVQVANPPLRQRALQRRLRKMRHPPRGGHRTHVDEQSDAMVGQQLGELVERPGRMADREDYGVRCEGSTAGMSMCLVIVTLLTWRGPEKRNAGS